MTEENASYDVELPPCNYPVMLAGEMFGKVVAELEKPEFVKRVIEIDDLEERLFAQFDPTRCLELTLGIMLRLMGPRTIYRIVCSPEMALRVMRLTQPMARMFVIEVSWTCSLAELECTADSYTDVEADKSYPPIAIIFRSSKPVAMPEPNLENLSGITSAHLGTNHVAGARDPQSGEPLYVEPVEVK